MIKYGTWKSEPANEDGWGVDWSIAEPDPEFLAGRDHFDVLFGCSDKKLRCVEYNGEGI